MPDIAEFRELDDDELFGRLADSRRELLNLRFQHATGQLDNISRIGLVKKDVARILTLLRDREIALAEGREAGPVVRPVRPARPARPVADEDEEERRPRRRARAVAGEAEALDEPEEDELQAEGDIEAENELPAVDDEADGEAEDEEEQ